MEKLKGNDAEVNFDELMQRLVPKDLTKAIEQISEVVDDISIEESEKVILTISTEKRRTRSVVKTSRTRKKAGIITSILIVVVMVYGREIVQFVTELLQFLRANGP
ncbi:MAG TPA: hypothetical protein VGE45_20605 [Chloroflexia bacterium]|jgi:hypothetical protein